MLAFGTQAQCVKCMQRDVGRAAKDRHMLWFKWESMHTGRNRFAGRGTWTTAEMCRHQFLLLLEVMNGKVFGCKDRPTLSDFIPFKFLIQITQIIYVLTLRHTHQPPWWYERLRVAITALAERNSGLQTDKKMAVITFWLEVTTSAMMHTTARNIIALHVHKYLHIRINTQIMLLKVKLEQQHVGTNLSSSVIRQSGLRCGCST